MGGPLVIAGALALALFLAASPWSGPQRSKMARSILNIDMIGGPLPFIVYSVALLIVLLFLLRRPTRRWMIAGSAGVVAGALLAVATLLVVSAINAVGVALSATTSASIIVTFAALGLAVATLASSRVWRKALATIGIIVFLLAGTLGVNADFGLDKTVADFAGTSTAKHLSLPRIKPASTPAPDNGALWANWRPPGNMPAMGTTGRVVIPNTLSRFRSRPAGLYLPPAALVANPPALPFVMMMMGQPGNPDPTFAAAILNAFASRHDRLAPIVLVVDQLGNPGVDPLCLNTAKYGNAQTFITEDAVNWARTHLHISQDPAQWTIAGYSNGGECALSFGVKYPDIWHNVLDISGEEYPGSDNAAQTLAQVFKGNRAAYAAQRPLTIMATKQYTGMTGIFTVGSNDSTYRLQAEAVSAAARASGWDTTFFEIPNGGHVLGALNGGLAEGFRILYPKLGLSAPSTTP